MADQDECSSHVEKPSFPDIGYALLGYNLVKGYPLAFGHDPGFTFPIFKADYKSRKHTADCRYKVPDGFVVEPDVSCITSFTSTIIETTHELDKSLSVLVESEGGAHFGVFEASFKASVGYKKSSSSISSGKSVIIISSAHCHYYFSKLSPYNPPQFSDVFIRWINQLNATNDKNIYFTFLDYFGTHYQQEVTFGAKYIVEYKMTQESYKSRVSKGTNVAVSASFSALGLVSGSVKSSVDSSSKENMSEFQKNVTSRTITSGATPPENGDAMTWASTVKENPVPVKYKIAPMHNLFTDRYISFLNVNYDKISSNLKKFMPLYCEYLQELGLVDSCIDQKTTEQESGNLVLTTTRLWRNAIGSKRGFMTDCIYDCMNKKDCVALSFCKTCDYSKDTSYDTCYMFSEHQTHAYGSFDENWESIVIRQKIKSTLMMRNTAIKGETRGRNTGIMLSSSECFNKCIYDVACVAFSHCDCPDQSENCKLYAGDSINYLVKEANTNAYFMSPYFKAIRRTNGTEHIGS